MMKKVLLFALSALLLFCSCERLFESRKEKFDRLVAAHWDAWKVEGKDTTMCFVDIAKVMPIEWDTMVYVWYDKFFDYENDGIINYMNNFYWLENERMKGYPEESLHFWKNGKLVYRISLLIASDDEKGVFFNTKSKFIVRDRNDATFHLKKAERFYIIRDLSEGYRSSRRYVQDYKTLE